MKKLKLYLDTSVISHLKAEDASDKMASTIKLWDEIKSNKYDVYISEMVTSEIEDCSEPKRTILFSFLDKINYNEIIIDDEIKKLSSKYIIENILSEKCKDDAIHIAAASVHNCDIIISWNFKHMVRFKTISGINGINRYMGYSNEIQILPPDSIVEVEEE